MSNGKHSRANYSITIVTSGVTLSFDGIPLLFTKEQAIKIVSYLCIEFKVHLNNGTSWDLRDGHKFRSKAWVDTTRNIYVENIIHHADSTISRPRGYYVCGTIVKESYKTYVLPQIEERKYLPCEFEISWNKRHTKKDLSRFNVDRPSQYDRTKIIHTNRYLNFKSLLLTKFT